MRKKNNGEVFYNNFQILHREDSSILFCVHYIENLIMYTIYAAMSSTREQICIFPLFCKRSERYLGCLENKSLNHWKYTLFHLHEEIWDSCRHIKVMGSSIFQKRGYAMTFWDQGLGPVSQKEIWGREGAWDSWSRGSESWAHLVPAF